jgi:hypothetical protein
MALSSGFTDAFGNTGGGTTDARSSQRTYMSQPSVTDPLAAALASLQQSLAGQYQGLLSNPTASPLFQGQLGPLLASLVPSEDRARQSLTDTFRAAGGLRSGAYGNSAAQLEGDILGKRQQVAGQLLGQAFPQLMQALQNPLGQVSSLIDALKLSEAQGARTSTGSGGGGGGSTLSDPFGVLSQRSVFSSPGPTSGGTRPLDQAFFGGYGGGASTGVNSSAGGLIAPTSTTNNAGSYDLLSRILGGSSTGFGPEPGVPTSEWSGAGYYQGGYQPFNPDYASTGMEY